MKIGLIDVDGHNFPNLALMKISAFHKSKGDSVGFVNFFEKYDLVYKSKVFTFTPDEQTIINADKIIEGGSGYDLKKELPSEIDTMLPDYDLYSCEHAYGFLTRGCIRKCDFCIVPEKEGKIKKYMDIEEIIGNKKTAILMDNNVIAHEHGLNQLEKINKMKLKVDFNQGLDSRIISQNIEIVKLLSKIKWLKPLRMACDSDEQLEHIIKSVELLRKYNVTPTRYFIYVLVKDVESAHKRIEVLKKLNLVPFAQPFISEKNKVSMEQKQFARWVNHKAIFNCVEWKNYKSSYRHKSAVDVIPEFQWAKKQTTKPESVI